MIALLPLLLLISQQKAITTSADILRAADISGRERTLAAKHRWILLGQWDETSKAKLASECKKLTAWRASDLAHESEKGQGESQTKLLANWKLQLATGPQSDLKKLLVDLNPESFPLNGLIGGKWIYIDKSGASGLSPSSTILANKLYEGAEKKWRKPDLRLYILIRKIDTRFVTYLSIHDSLGKSLELQKVMFNDFDPSSPIPGNSFDCLGADKKRILKAGEISDGIPRDGVKTKEFDWREIDKAGLLRWFKQHYFNRDPNNQKPVAILANDFEIVNFVRQGGTAESYLTSLGYRAFECDQIVMVLPPFLPRSEDCRVLEQQVAGIRQELDCSIIIDRYAHWVAESGLQSDFELLTYLAGTLAQQRKIPELFLEIYPLLPTLQGLELIDRNNGTTINRLQSTRNGLFGDTLLHGRTNSSFEFSETFPNDETLGYYFGPSGREQIRDVTTKIEPAQRIIFSEIAPLAMDPEMASRNVTWYGDTWPMVEKKLNERKVTLVAGDAVTISFRSTLNRPFSYTFFFEKETVKTAPYGEMPQDFRDKVKKQTEELFKEFNDKSQPPPN